EIVVLVALLLPVAADDPAQPRHLIVIRRNDPALARRHVLRRIKAETTRAEAPGAPPSMLGAVRLRGIFNQRQLEVVANLADLAHPRRMPVQVHRHHCLRLIGDRVFQLVRVEVEVEWVDIDEYRHRPTGHNARRRRDEAERRRDHLIARPHSVGLQRHDERGRAAVHPNGVSHPDIAGKCLFERFRARALGKLAAVQHLHDRALLGIADERLRNGDKRTMGSGHGGPRAKCGDDYASSVTSPAPSRRYARPQWPQTSASGSRRAQAQTQPMGRAGLPPTSAWSGTSFVTTEPAAMSAQRPIVTPVTITDREPIAAPYFTSVRPTSQSLSLFNEPSGLMARGKRSFVNTTSGPTNTPSSSVAPKYTQE